VLRHEVETLGFLLSAHPLDPYRDAVRNRGVIAARDLHRHAGKRVTVLGWYVTSKLVHTKDDEPMEFLSFEDTTALYDATIFPDAYRRFCHLLTSTRPFLLAGRVEEDHGVHTLTVERVERLEPAADRAPAHPPGRLGPGTSAAPRGAAHHANTGG
jgi:error-prone DNA polymerase